LTLLGPTPLLDPSPLVRSMKGPDSRIKRSMPTERGASQAQWFLSSSPAAPWGSWACPWGLWGPEAAAGTEQQSIAAWWKLVFFTVDGEMGGWGGSVVGAFIHRERGRRLWRVINGSSWVPWARTEDAMQHWRDASLAASYRASAVITKC
jgi:hypothetical protein